MAKHNTSNTRPLLGGFVRLNVLWTEDTGKQMFGSEYSARWFIRQHRNALVDAQAICQHAGEILVHPPRFEAVAEAVALAAVRRTTAA